MSNWFHWKWILKKKRQSEISFQFIGSRFEWYPMALEIKTFRKIWSLCCKSRLTKTPALWRTNFKETTFRSLHFKALKHNWTSLRLWRKNISQKKIVILEMWPCELRHYLSIIMDTVFVNERYERFTANYKTGPRSIAIISNDFSGNEFLCHEISAINNIKHVVSYL